MAMKTLIAMVEAGEPVMVFPEGRITVTGSIMKIYDGPAFVAAKTNCSVVPVHISGAVYSKVSRMAGDVPRKLFPKIGLTIHEPVTLEMPEGRTAKIRRRIASERMRRLMQEAAYRSRVRTTIPEALIDAAALHGRGRQLLRDINSNFNPVSYRTILKGALALGRLASRLSATGEFVGVMLPNANATAYLVVGLMGMRRIPAMLNYTSGAEGMRQACIAAGVKTVLTSRAFIEKAKLENAVRRLEETAAAGIPGFRIVYLEDLRKQFTLADKLWLMGWALWNPRSVLGGARPEDPAVTLFTSGSEGIPKGVVLSHDSILANCAQIDAAYPFSSRDSFLSSLPLFHAFGLTAGLLLPLLSGCRVVLYPSPLHYRTVPEYIYDHDCTVLFTTSTFLRNYIKAAHPYDLYNTRNVVVGAEKLSEEVARLCIEKFGVRPVEGYGATECSPVIAVNTPLAYRMGTVGEALPGIECAITPVPGIERGGMLHVRGDNVMLGYLKSDRPGVLQPPVSAFGPGWYETGDVVVINEGFIAIQARLKRFAKVAGEMVSLEVVESIANAARAALHAAVSIPDPARGEALVLFTEAADLTREDLTSAARRLGAPEVSVPRRIAHLPKLPLLGNGKKDYAELQRMAIEQFERRETRA
jgi:acyl-[acyl-carrier-protein]-phospholipid O-acyltransferase/long-chain-fatty-acid--[acyl-carrier-protein] ligase